MSAAENKALARRFFEALDQKDWDAIGNLLTDDYVGHLSGAPPMDYAGKKQFGVMFHGAFPDCAHVIEDQVAEGDRVVTRLTLRATQTGDMMGVPPSNKSITLTGVQVLRLGNGKIAEEWTEFDQLGMLQQIGALPAPPQPEPTTALVS